MFQFNPRTLRLCCLAAMAPALTSEATSRARDKLVSTPPNSDLDHPHPAVSNGRGGKSPSPASSPSGKCHPPGLIKCTNPTQTNPSPLKSQAQLVSLTELTQCLLQGRSKKIIELETRPILGDICKQEIGKETGIPEDQSKSMNPAAADLTVTASGREENRGSGLGMTPQTTALAVNKPASSMTVATQPSSAASSAEACTATVKSGLTNGLNSLSHSQNRMSRTLAPHTITRPPTPPPPPTTTIPIKLSECFLQPQTFYTSSVTSQSMPSTNYSTRGLQEPDMLKRQKQLEARTDRILRRLRRLQTRQAISHTRQQMTGFVDHQHQNLETVRTSKAQSPTTADLKAELFQSRDVKKLSTATLVNLVQKLQSSQPMTLRQHLAGVTTEGAEQEKILRLDDENCTEFERTAGHLSSNLHHLESALDSDATESSSGGESCDEMDYDYDWDGRTQPKPSITQRAEWKWSVERAAVASRWTWLQAQVSDLEYRIRQQNDIYRQIRASKGAVVLSEHVQIDDLIARCKAQQQAGKKLTPLEEKLLTLDRSSMSPADLQQVLNSVTKQSTTQPTQQCGSVHPADTNDGSKTSPVPNGFVENGLVGSTGHGPVPATADSGDAKRPAFGSDGGDGPQAPLDVDFTCQAARCRPVRSYRKRKLLRTSGLHLTSRKASRLSTVKCRCFPPMVPCAMCGGRYNNVMQLEPDIMPLAERVSLLDPAFHSVLSFMQDIPLAIHFESLLKTGEWQHKQPLRHLKNLHKLQAVKRPKQPREGVRKYTRRINKSQSAVVLSSARIKNKYESHKVLSRRPDGALASTPKKNLPERTRTRLCRSEVKLRNKLPTNRREAMREMKRLLSSMDRSRRSSTSAPGTPLASSNSSEQLSLSHSGSLTDLRRRRGPNAAYDINNIVIPYSMAASTRVEKLQYKEIITPKWREVLEKYLPGIATGSLARKKLMRHDADASDSSTDTADSGTDFLADSGSETVPPKPETTMKLNAELAPAPTDMPDVSANAGGAPPVGEPAKSETEGMEPKAQKVEEKIESDANSAASIATPQSDEVEDLSEEAHYQRHLRCELQEKQKFASYMQMQRRGRGSRTESGTLSPGPDGEGPTAATPPATPKPSNENEEEGLNRSGSFSSMRSEEGPRRRTSSLSKGSHGRSASQGEDRSRLSYQADTTVTPWPRRAFPLGDIEVDSLTMDRPPEPPPDRPSIVQNLPGSSQPQPLFTLDAETPTSPLSSLGDAEEDPNDPEWTVITEKNAAQGQKPCLVLKLAKR